MSTRQEPSKESDLRYRQNNSGDSNLGARQKETNSEKSDYREDLSWWQPLSYLALSVHGMIWSVGEWAWSKTQSSVGEALGSAQRRTSLVYESMRFKSNSSINTGALYENLQIGFQSRYMGALEKIVSGYERCKENVNLAVIQTKLRFQLATNDYQFRGENYKADTKRRWSERFDESIKKPLENLTDKLSYAKCQTQTRVLRYKDSLTASVNDNLDSITLKAKEYEDTMEHKFPNLSVKLARKNKLSSTTQVKIMIVWIAILCAHMSYRFLEVTKIPFPSGLSNLRDSKMSSRESGRSCPFPTTSRIDFVR